MIIKEKIRKPRFHSVKAINTRQMKQQNLNSTQKIDIMQYFQRSLDILNHTSNPQISQIMIKIPGQQEIILENKIWNYFKHKITGLQNKVEKQRVNIESKIMDTIIKQTEKKIQNIQKLIMNYSNTIKTNYKQSHQLYEEMQLMKTSRKANKHKQQASRMKDEYYREKINVLCQNISNILHQTKNLEQQLIRANKQLTRIKDQRLSFLRNILQQGYYRDDGMKWVLLQMINIQYVPSIDDMPEFLDKYSKQCLLLEYENLLKKSNNEAQMQNYYRLPPIKSSVIASQVGNKKDQLRQIYASAKVRMSQFIKNKQWNEYQPNLFSSRLNFKTQYRWRQQQKSRVKSVYTPQSARKMMRVLFGTRLQSTSD